MLPWIELATARVPGDGAQLRLMRRGDEFSIMAGSIELMNSRLAGSEEALATLSFARLAAARAPAILVGGLGMGFTLRALLAIAPPEARILVAELVPEVVAWARGPLAALHAGSLDDRRVSIEIGDVLAAMAARPGACDAILLDVDNGPDGLSRDANDRLYAPAGLATARAALRPGGILAVWAAAADAGFTRRLGAAGFAVDEVPTRARRGKGARHMIWLATRR
jgi:spermidine synthase